MNRGIVILHAPSPLGLKPPAEGRVPGVRHMPEALRRAGLHDALGVRTTETVEPPEYVAHRDPVTNVRNLDAIERYSVALADAVEPLLKGPELVVVLGGDCSIFIGVALALKRMGRYGVIYIDAHSDCQSPENSETGGIAGMPLAAATGRAPASLAHLEDRAPFVADEDVALVGVRDLFDVGGTRTRHIEGTRIRVRDLADVVQTGPETVASQELAQLGMKGVDGIWVHLDVDVLDPGIMPAVDSPDPGGLTAAQLLELLRPLVCSPAVKGMQVTIYDPERDPDGRAGATLVDILRESFHVSG